MYVFTAIEINAGMQKRLRFKANLQLHTAITIATLASKMRTKYAVTARPIALKITPYH